MSAESNEEQSDFNEDEEGVGEEFEEQKHFRRMKRLATQGAVLAQQEFIKKQKEIEETEADEDEDDYYNSEANQIKTFKKLGARLFQSYIKMLSGTQTEESTEELNHIIRNYLNNGNVRENDYLDERELHAGDLVIEFPNPDYSKPQFPNQNKKKSQFKTSLNNTMEESAQMDQSRKSDADTDADTKKDGQNKKSNSSVYVKRINLNQARDDFKKAFGMIDASLRADVSENKIFQITFENVFRKLASSPADDDQVYNLEESDDEVNSIDEKFDILERKSRPKEGSYDTLATMKHLLLRSKQHSQKQLTQKLTQKFNFTLIQDDENNGNNNNNPSSNKNYEAKNKNQGNEQSDVDEVSDSSSVFDNSMESTSFLNSKRNKLQGISLQAQKFLKNEKLRKILSKGGFFKLTEDQKTYIRSSLPTQDYFTLIRHATWIRLIKQGFKLRHFFSKDGKSIFTVCYATDYNLKITAEKEKLSKALNMEFSDLLSFEPVDPTLRPLRINSRIQKNAGNGDIEGDDQEGSEKKEVLSGYLRHIRDDVQRLLSIIDYKKIAKETNLENLNSEILNVGETEVKKDENLSDHQWELYLLYLNQVSEKVQEVRKEYKFIKGDNKAQLINEIIEFQKIKHPIQIILQAFLDRDDQLMADNRSQNSEDEGNPYQKLLEQGPKMSSKDETQMASTIRDYKDMREDKGYLNKREMQRNFDDKEMLKQRRSDLKTVKGLFKKYRVIQTIMKIRSKRVRNLLIEILVEPVQLKKRYEQMEQDVRDHETKYSSLREIFSLRPDKLLHVKYIKLYKHQQMAFKYREVFEKALDVVNYPNKEHVKLWNIWDYMGVRPQETYVNYFRTPSNISFKKKQKLNQIWLNYIVSQNGKVSQFSNMERVKLINMSVQKAVNIFYLKEKGFIKQSFFMNDVFDLHGKTQKYIFNGCQLNDKEIQKQNKIEHIRQAITQANKKEQEQAKNDQDEQEDVVKQESQNISRGQNQEVHTGMPFYSANHMNAQNMSSSELASPNPHQKKSSKKQKAQNSKPVENAKPVERLFVKKKIKNIEYEWAFQISCPWYVPHQFIRDYYGEKVALYFSFLGYYTRSLLFMGIIGLGIFIIQQLNFFKKPENENYLNMGFGCAKIIWASTTLYDWKRKEKIFASAFGQIQDKKEDEERNVDEEERPGFDGIYQRSLITDNLNSIYYPKYKRFLKVGLTLVTCFVMLGLYFSLIIIIFLVPNYLERFSDSFPILSGDFYKVIAPGLMNFFLYLSFNKFIYSSFSNVLTDFENHKSFSEYENNYVAKKFIFSFISLTGPLFMIAFIGDQYPDFRCSYQSCYIHSQYHFAVVFISLFLFNFVEIIKPAVEQKFRNFMSQREMAKIEKQNQEFLDNQQIASRRGETTPLQIGQSQIDKKKIKLNIPRTTSHENDEEMSEFGGQQSEDNLGPKAENKIFNDAIRKVEIEELINDNRYEKLDNNQKRFNNQYLKKHPHALLNIFIQNEAQKSEYSKSADIYGTVDEYLEICIQYSMLTMFGMMFPLSFAIAFFWNITELLSDKMNIMKYTQRPIPLGEGTIGSWLNLMDMASYLAILTNSGLITYLQSKFSSQYLVQVFLALIVFNFMAKFMQSAILGDMPYRIQNLLKRQEYIIRSTVDIFKKSNSKEPEVRQEDVDEEREIQQQLKNQANKDHEGKFGELPVDELNEEEEEKLEKMRRMRITKFDARPVYKIFNTFLEPQENSILHDSIDQSYMILSSGDEENVVDDAKKKNGKAKNQQKENEEKQIEIKKYLWSDFKFHAHQGVLLRPIFIKQQYLQEIQQYRDFHERQMMLFLKYVKKIENPNTIREKIPKYNRQVHILQPKGNWAHQFRMVDNYQSSEQILEKLYKIRLEEQQQKNFNIYDKIDLNISLITEDDIEKYFGPRGPYFVYSESYLKQSIYYKMLFSMQTINMKKMIIQKSSQEILQTPFNEEKLYSERLLWDITKQRFIIDLYLPKDLNLSPNLNTLIPNPLSHTLQNWRIDVNQREEMMSFQIIHLNDGIQIPLYLFEVTEPKLRDLSRRQNEPGYPEFYIAKQVSSFLSNESYFNFETREQGYLFRRFNEKYIGSLSDMIKRRKAKKMRYEEKELLGFLEQWIINLDTFELNYELFHSNITPSTLVLTLSSNQEYKNLISGDESAQFLRDIEDEELTFIAPEVITHFFRPQDQYQNALDLYGADLYSLCMIMLYMATLGEAQEQIMKIKRQNMNRNVEKIEGVSSLDQSQEITGSQIFHTQKSAASKRSDTANQKNLITPRQTGKKETSQRNPSMTYLTGMNLSTSVIGGAAKKTLEFDEKTFNKDLTEGENISLFVKNYLSEHAEKMLSIHYPILYQVIKKVLLTPNPLERPSRQELLSMIEKNEKVQFQENQDLTRFAYEDFTSYSESLVDWENQGKLIQYNTYMKAIVYNKLALYEKTLNLFSNYYFKVEDYLSFEETHRVLHSQLILIEASLGCCEKELAISQIEQLTSSISYKLQGNFSQQQTEEFRIRGGSISKKHPSSTKNAREEKMRFYQQQPFQQMSLEERQKLTKLQNNCIYLQAFLRLMFSDSSMNTDIGGRKFENNDLNNSNDLHRQKQTKTLSCKDYLDFITEKVDNDCLEDLISYLQANFMKLRLFTDQQNILLFEQLAAKIEQQLNGKSTIRIDKKRLFSKALLSKFNIELAMIQSEFLISQTRYTDAQKKLEEFTQTPFFEQRNQFSQSYLDNDFSLIKDQILFYSMQSDLCISTESLDSYQECYQFVKRNLLALIISPTFTLSYFYDILENLFHLVDMDSLKFDILQKLVKNLEFVYMHQYFPVKLTQSINSLQDVRIEEESLFNPFIQFLLGKTFIGLESTKDRENGYTYLSRAYRIIRFEVEDQANVVQVNEESDTGAVSSRMMIALENNNQRSKELLQVSTNQFPINEKSITVISQAHLDTSSFNNPNQVGQQNNAGTTSGNPKFQFIYNENLEKIAQQFHMNNIKFSYYFYQRLIENILYCVNQNENLGQEDILQNLTYLYRIRPYRKVHSIFLSPLDHEKMKREIEILRSQKEKKNPIPSLSKEKETLLSKDALLICKNHDQIKIDATYVHHYVEFMRKAKLYIQFKKYNLAINQLRILNSLITLYTKSFDKSKKKFDRKQQAQKKAGKGQTDEKEDNEKDVEDFPIFQSVVKMLTDQIYIFNLISFCYYGLKEYKSAKSQLYKLFKSENLDYLGPNYTIIRNIKGCMLVALDYRQMGIFQSSLMLTEIVDKVLQKVGHYPSIQKTKLIQDLQILKCLVLFEASQLEFLYGYDEIKQQQMFSRVREQEEEYLDGLPDYMKKSSPKKLTIRDIGGLNREDTPQLQETLDKSEEELEQYKMRGFYLSKQVNSLQRLSEMETITKYSLQEQEVLFFEAVCSLELGKFGKAYQLYEKVWEFKFDEFVSQNANNVSQFQFVFEKPEFTMALNVLTRLIEFCSSLLAAKLAEEEHLNIYYKQVFESITDLVVILKAKKFIVKCKIGKFQDEKEDFEELTTIGMALRKNLRFAKKDFTFMQLAYLNFAYMHYHLALDSLRAALKIVNKMISNNKQIAQSHDFSTKVTMKTISEIAGFDSQSDKSRQSAEAEHEDGDTTRLYSLDEYHTSQNLFENLISLDNLRTELEIREIELEINLFDNQLYELYYKTKDLLEAIIIRKGEQSWYYFKAIMIKTMIFLKLMENEKGISIFGLIEYQKKIKVEKVQLFQTKVYQIFGFKANKSNLTEEEQKQLEETQNAKKIMKKYFSQKRFEEEEAEGLQGKIKIIIQAYTEELEVKDKALRQADINQSISTSLKQSEDLLKKIFNTSNFPSFENNEDFAIFNMIYAQFLLSQQEKNLIDSKKRFKKSLQIYKETYQTLVHPNIAIIYLRMARMQIQVVKLIQKFIDFLVNLEMQSISGKVDVSLLEFAIKRMIMMDEQIFDVLREYSLNGIVIFLVDSLIQIREKFHEDENNEDTLKLIYFKKDPLKAEMEKSVKRVTHTCSDILRKIFEEKQVSPGMKVEDVVINDIYERAQMEIISMRRAMMGSNVKYMQKESEIKFENKRIKYLRRSLMIIKRNSQVESELFKEVEAEYLHALEDNLDFREESDFLKYDEEVMNQEQKLSKKRILKEAKFISLKEQHSKLQAKAKETSNVLQNLKVKFSFEPINEDKDEHEQPSPKTPQKKKN